MRHEMMMKRRQQRFRSHAAWLVSEEQESSSDSSAEEEEVRDEPSPLFTDENDSGSEGESESSQSESEPEMTSRGRASFRTLARKARGNSLLKLVNSKDADVEKARAFLSNLTPEQITKEVGTRDGRGNTVIHYACMKTLVPWVEMLAHHGADLDVKGAGGKRPIHLAVKDRVRVEGQAEDKARLVELLVSKKVQVNVKDAQGQTPLQMATKYDGQKKVIRALLAHSDIRVDQPVKFGRVSSTLLNVCCHNAQFETALLLLKHGANPLAINASRNTPLYAILRKGNVKYAMRFLSVCQHRGHDMRKILMFQNIYQKTVLHEVIKTGNEMLIKCCMLCVSPSDNKEGSTSNDYLLQMRSRFNTTIMHTACKRGHLDIVHMLHDLCPRLLEAKNSKGWTPLHYACRGNFSEVAEELCTLLHSHDKNLHLTMDEDDVDGTPSLLKFTAVKGSSDCLIVLLKHVTDPTTIVELVEWISVEKNLSFVLQELLNRFDDISTGTEAMDIEKIILQCAAKGQTESLLEFVAWHKRTIFVKDVQENTPMHLVAEGGHLDTAKAILKNEDVSLCEQNVLGQTPLHLTIKQGHKLTTRLLLKTDKLLAGMVDNKQMTPLMYACKVGNLLIVKMLLELTQDEIQFFACDRKGRNCLDHAIRNGHEMVAVTLLSQKNWRTLMAHSTGEGSNKTTPMRNLITSMPAVCRFVLDKCITRLTDEDIDDTSLVKIKVDYEFLEDWFSEWMQDQSQSRYRRTFSDVGYGMIMRTISTLAYPEQQLDIPEETSNFNGKGMLKDDARIFVTDPAYRSQNHPLRLMIQKDESKVLLNHPVVRLMFRYKHKSTRLKYWISLFLQITLVILLTGHSLVIPPPFYVQSEPGGENFTWLADGEVKWKDGMNAAALVLFGKVGTWIILVVTLVYFVEYVYRIWIYRHSTFNSIRGLSGLLREMALQVFIILFIIPGQGDVHYAYGVYFKPDWQWQLGAFAVFLTWFNFILFLQTVPFFGLYIFMFLEVLSTLLNFVFVVAIFIMTFAIVFCILLLNQAPFHTLGNSIAKIVGMASGEINFSDVFHSLDYLYQPIASIDFTNMVFYPASTHVIFALFIIFMPILIMNLLTGLAVYDIEIIQTKAKMYKRTLEAKGILDTQDNSLLFLWKNSVLRDEEKMIRTELSPMHKLFYKAIGYKETHDQLVSFLEELEKKGSVEFTKTTEMKIADMSEHINDMRNKLNMLAENAIDAKMTQVEGNASVQELKQQIQALQDRFDKIDLKG